MTRVQLADLIRRTNGNLERHARIAALEAENAALKKLVEHLTTNAAARAEGQDRAEAENAKLRELLRSTVPWIGEPCEGPEWATPDAKASNREMCDKVFADATAYFEAAALKEADDGNR